MLLQDLRQSLHAGGGGDVVVVFRIIRVRPLVVVGWSPLPAAAVATLPTPLQRQVGQQQQRAHLVARAMVGGCRVKNVLAQGLAQFRAEGRRGGKRLGHLEIGKEVVQGSYFEMRVLNDTAGFLVALVAVQRDGGRIFVGRLVAKFREWIDKGSSFLLGVIKLVGRAPSFRGCGMALASNRRSSGCRFGPVPVAEEEERGTHVAWRKDGDLLEDEETSDATLPRWKDAAPVEKGATLTVYSLHS